MRALLIIGFLLLVSACGSRAPAPSAPVQPETAPAQTGTETAPAETGTGTAAAPAETGTGTAQPEALPPVACNREDAFGPAQVSDADYAARHGAGIHDVSRLVTSKERPVEVCGVQAELDYLVQLRCADGSQPFATRRDAHRARSGSLGTGGRCGGVIDLYEVPCPEATYPVYMDLYFCRAGESF